MHRALNLQNFTLGHVLDPLAFRLCSAWKSSEALVQMAPSQVIQFGDSWPGSQKAEPEAKSVHSTSLLGTKIPGKYQE